MNPSKNFFNSPFWGERQKMTDIIKNKIAVNCNQKEIQQMVIGSDVISEQKEVAMADSYIVSDVVLNKACETTDVANDNNVDDGGGDMPPSTAIIEQIDSEQKNIEHSLIIDKKFLPKEEFELKYKEAFAKSLEFLRYELALAEKIRNIETAQGTRKDLGGSAVKTRTKKEILLQDFGLKEKTAWEIQQLTEDLIKKIITKALNEQRLPTRGLGIKILEKEKKIQKAESETEEKAAIKKEKFQQKMARDHEKYVAQNTQMPRVLNGNLFDVIWVDPDQCGISINDLYDMDIPAADNAILFWWIQPTKLFETVDVIKKWAFRYTGETIWDLDDQAVYSGGCFNQTHRMLLVATRGKNPPLAYQETRKKKSVLKSRPGFDEKDKPAYYRESIERMFPKGAFLDLLATNSVNPKWTAGIQEEKKEVSDGTNCD